MTWTRPRDIRARLEKHWARGELLAARLRGDALFPLRIPCRSPKPADIAERFDDVRRWVAELKDNDREALGYGYRIEWRRVNLRVHGANDLPAAFVVETEADALRLIGKERAARQFDALAEQTLSRFPALREWLARRPLTALERAEEWDRWLAVLEHFQRRPRPGVYLRQLDIAGVDTKFIETRRALLIELLDAVLPPDAVDIEAKGARQFERRYGLREKPARVRFRLLDPALRIQGLRDLAVPVEEFAQLELPVRRVFITENEINGLAFPDVDQALVIFGLGYALDSLRDNSWLQSIETIFYWGDIDTHGFAILDRLRAHLPDTRSFLMDRGTFETHRSLAVDEPEAMRHKGELTRLTPPEQSLFEALRDGEYQGLRLEQERLPYGWVTEAVAGLTR